MMLQRSTSNDSPTPWRPATLAAVAHPAPSIGWGCEPTEESARQLHRGRGVGAPGADGGDGLGEAVVRPTCSHGDQVPVSEQALRLGAQAKYAGGVC